MASSMGYMRQDGNCFSREFIDGESPAARGRLETIHRMTRRCFGWDYRQRAIYQITLVQADRQRPLLGRVTVDDPSAPPESVAARFEPSEVGDAILAHWKRIGEFTPEIKPLYCQLMPDHLHAILEVTRPMAKPLGNAIGGFKTGCEKLYRELALSAQNKEFALSAQNKELALSAQNKGLMPSGRNVARGACSVSGAQAPDQFRLWAPGFQDTILFRAGQLDRMFNYLRDNPRRLAVKRLYPDLFRVVTDCRLKLGERSGRFFLRGNRFLLDRPLLQVQVSRADFVYRREPIRGGGKRIVRDAAGVPQIESCSAAFEEKCGRLLEEAKHGAVLLSPCVSDGEREVARLAFERKLPLVAMRNKGFAPLEKPSGRSFDACADGRLLQLAPACWPFVPGEKPMTRRDAQVMNRLSQWLAGAGAAEINYHGVTFAEIDRLASDAVEG